MSLVHRCAVLPSRPTENNRGVVIFTACRPGCGKVKFSQVSVHHSVKVLGGGAYLWSHVLSGGWVSLVTGPFGRHQKGVGM